VAKSVGLQGLSAVQQRVLLAVVEGYRAREGMKDRIRALNEWEIARRADGTALSYAEFTHDPSRGELVRVLGELQQLGLISTWERGIHYDTFIPTPRGDQVVSTPGAEDQVPTGAPTAERGAIADPVCERLDEIIELLRSIRDRLPEPH